MALPLFHPGRALSLLQALEGIGHRSLAGHSSGGPQRTAGIYAWCSWVQRASLLEKIARSCRFQCFLASVNIAFPPNATAGIHEMASNAFNSF